MKPTSPWQVGSLKGWTSRIQVSFKDFLEALVWSLNECCMEIIKRIIAMFLYVGNSLSLLLQIGELYFLSIGFALLCFNTGLQIYDRPEVWFYENEWCWYSRSIGERNSWQICGGIRSLLFPNFFFLFSMGFRIFLKCFQEKIFCVSCPKISSSDIFFSAREKIAVPVSTDLEDDVIFWYCINKAVTMLSKN